MWLQFLARMSLLDEVVVNTNASGTVSVELECVKVGQLRSGGPISEDERQSHACCDSRY